MTTTQFRALAGAQPFQPFLILTADGREYRVAHPEMMWIPPGFNTVHVVWDGQLAMIDIPAVVALRPEPAPNSGASRG